MIDQLLQAGISNACIAIVLAGLATIVGSVARRPQLAYLLWLLVFVKLITPPIFNIPIDIWQETGVVATPLSVPHLSPVEGNVESGVSFVIGTQQAPTSRDSKWLAAWLAAKPWLGAAWLAGILTLACYSSLKIVRFDRLLREGTQTAPVHVQKVVDELCQRFGIRTRIEFRMTSAQLAPLVWWTGGPIQVVIPKSLLQELKPDQWRLVIAHELAHVRRRDYGIRWLECVACTCFWWNPIVWWAQQNLRATEEICCDALVIAQLQPSRYDYAHSILTTVESLVRTEFRPPAMASEINSGGFLERRFETMMSNHSSPRHLRRWQCLVALFSLIVIPFGLVEAQDFEKVEKRLNKSVQKGELSERQMGAMMNALRRSSAGDRQENMASDDKKFSVAGKKIRAAVEAGKLTPEEGRAKIRELRMKMASRDAVNRELSAAQLQIRAAVAQGEITKEAARARVAEMKEHASRKQEAMRQREIRLNRVLKAENSIKDAVEAGEISHAVAVERMRALKLRVEMAELKKVEAEMMAATEEGRVKQEKIRRRMIDVEKQMKIKADPRSIQAYRDVEIEIRQAVENGNLTRKEAGQKLKAVRFEIFGGEAHGSHERREQADRKHDRPHNKEVDLKEMARRLKHAVEAGEISEQDAASKWKALERRFEELHHHEQRSHDRDDKIHAIAKKLKAMVDAGKLTGEQAREKLEAEVQAIRKARHARDDHNRAHDDHEHSDHEHDDHDDHEHEHDGDDGR